MSRLVGRFSAVYSGVVEKGAELVMAGRNEPSQRHNDISIPPEFTELIELRSTAIARKLGYPGRARFVIFGYAERGGEVFWKDGQTSGFGLGHWQFLLEKIEPLASRYGAELGGEGKTATHVLVVDRVRRLTYVTCRDCAASFLARIHGRPLPARKCLCDSGAQAGPALRERG